MAYKTPSDFNTAALSQDSQDVTLTANRADIVINAKADTRHEGETSDILIGDVNALLRHNYVRDGNDLLLEPKIDDTLSALAPTVHILDYFDTEAPARLVSPEGAQIAGSLAAQLARPVDGMQLAQSQGEAIDLGEAVGSITQMEGSAEVIHTNGQTESLQVGSVIYTNDVVETNSSSKVGLTFNDATVASLGENGRMVVDSFYYDPESGGDMSLNFVQGVFSFASGAIAKTGDDAMSIQTPVALMGIRGTTVAVEIKGEGALNSFTLLPDADGGVGEISVTNDGGEQILNQPYQTSAVTGYATSPALPRVLSPLEIQQTYQGITDFRPSQPDYVRPTKQAENQQSEEEGSAEEAPEDAPEETSEETSEDAPEETLEAEALDAETLEAEDAATEAESVEAQDTELEDTQEESSEQSAANEAGESEESIQVEDASSKTWTGGLNIPESGDGFDNVSGLDLEQNSPFKDSSRSGNEKTETDPWADLESLEDLLDLGTETETESDSQEQTPFLPKAQDNDNNYFVSEDTDSSQTFTAGAGYDTLNFSKFASGIRFDVSNIGEPQTVYTSSQGDANIEVTITDMFERVVGTSEDDHFVDTGNHDPSLSIQINAAKGDDSFTYSGSAGNISFYGGKGNDTLYANANITNNDSSISYNGSDGNNDIINFSEIGETGASATFVSRGSTDSNVYKLKNVEGIVGTSGDDSFTFSESLSESSKTTIYIDAGDGDNDTLTLNFSDSFTHFKLGTPEDESSSSAPSGIETIAISNSNKLDTSHEILELHESSLSGATLTGFNTNSKLIIDFDSLGDAEETVTKSAIEGSTLQAGAGRIYETSSTITASTAEGLFKSLVEASDGSSLSLKQDQQSDVSSDGIIITYKNVSSSTEPQHDAYIFKYSDEDEDGAISASELSLITKIEGAENTTAGWLNATTESEEIVLT